MRSIALFIFCFSLAFCTNSCQMSRLRAEARFDAKKSVFQAGTQSYTFIDIPPGYLSKDIRIVKGDKYSMLIFYQDSSLLYFCESSLESPNYNNIENLNNPASKWRNHASSLLEVQQCDFGSDFLNLQPSSCLYSWGEILSFGPKNLIDLNGTNERMEFWRDVKVGDFCIGYITRNVNRINDFDVFLTDNIKSLKVGNIINIEDGHQDPENK